MTNEKDRVWPKLASLTRDCPECGHPQYVLNLPDNFLLWVHKGCKTRDICETRILKDFGIEVKVAINGKLLELKKDN